MPMIEPDKEGLAIQRLVRTGAMTFGEMVRERGGDPEAHWDAYAAEQKMLKAKGIVVDSDASQVSQAGQAQMEPSTQIP
jgi:capsid protein